jgi:hypothetical protein
MTQKLTLLLLAVEFAGAGFLIYRRLWRDFPASISYLAFCFASHAASLWNQPVALTVSLLPGFVLRCWMLSEVYARSRSQWEPREARIMAAIGVGAALALTAGTWMLEDRPALGNIAAANEYLTLALMGGSWALVARARWWPMLERVRNRAYRAGVAGIMTVLGLSSGFGRGGFAYAFVPQTEDAWMAVRIGVLGSLSLIVAAMVIGMARQEHSKRVARIAGCAKRSNVVEMKRAA